MFGNRAQLQPTHGKLLIAPILIWTNTRIMAYFKFEFMILSLNSFLRLSFFQKNIKTWINFEYQITNYLFQRSEKYFRF